MTLRPTLFSAVPVAAATNEVVATDVSASPTGGFGAVGFPVRTGLFMGAYTVPTAVPFAHFAPS